MATRVPGSPEGARRVDCWEKGMKGKRTEGEMKGGGQSRGSQMPSADVFVFHQRRSG